MRIENSFTVSLPAEDAWKVLLDVERIAPCMPGAELQEVAGDEYRGIVKVKLGAITAQYKGAVRFAEVDEVGRRIVLKAEGRETRGQGNASATVTATLTDAGEGATRVAIETDLTISGKIAQFGRGVMADVSAKLLAEFAGCLEREVLAGDAGRVAADEIAEVPTAAEVAADEIAEVAADEIAEVLADEIADVAVDSPERAARLVTAVAPESRTVHSKPGGPSTSWPWPGARWPSGPSRRPSSACCSCRCCPRGA